MEITTKTKILIPRPPAHLFLSGSPFVGQFDVRKQDPEEVKKFLQERIIEKLEYPKTGGILFYFKNAERPRWGFPFPEATQAINAAKKYLMLIIQLVRKFPFLIFWHKFLFNSWNDFATRFLRQYHLKDEYMCPAVLELKNALLAAKYPVSFALNIATVAEFDNIYRFTMQDVFGELRDNELSIDQIPRLLDIWEAREGNITLLPKIKLLKRLMWFKFLRKKVAEILDMIDVDKIKLDENDLYWAKKRTNYKWQGK